MKTLWLLSVLLCYQSVAAQTYITRNGYVGFFSKTPLEDIRAENRQVYAVIDTDKKNLAFALLVKGFLFTKELMQEHFNENYIESDKYPKASFAGNYTGDVNVMQNGVYPVTAKGQVTLHGVTQTIEVPATIEVQNGKLIGKANFQLKPSDFDIKIPSLVREKIAPYMDVRVLVTCNPK